MAPTRIFGMCMDAPLCTSPSIRRQLLVAAVALAVVPVEAEPAAEEVQYLALRVAVKALVRLLPVEVELAVVQDRADSAAVDVLPRLAGPQSRAWK